MSVIAACLAAFACAAPAIPADAAADELTVFAASSVAEIADEIARENKTALGNVRLHRGASGALAAQIRAGAPCDVFLAADEQFALALSGENLILPDTLRPLATNQLVIVVPNPSAAPWTDASPLTDPSLARIAIARPDAAPAGAAARAALTALNLWPAVEPRIVYADNVRMAARYVAEGAAQAAIVYATDARAFADRVAVVHRFDPALHQPLVIAGAVCSRAADPHAAKQFLNVLTSDAAAEIWRERGFLPAPKSASIATPATALVPPFGANREPAEHSTAADQSHDPASAILISLKVSLAAVAIFLLPGAALGLWLARGRSMARQLTLAIVSIPLVLPPVVTGLLLLKLFVAAGLPIAFTWYAAAVASGCVALPLLVRTVRAGAETIDPRLIGAARSLGATRWRATRTVTLPLCRRAIIGGAVLFWARALGEFGAVMVVAGNTPGQTATVPLAIYARLESPSPQAVWPLVAISIVISVAAIVLSEWLARRPRWLAAAAPSREHAAY